MSTVTLTRIYKGMKETKFGTSPTVAIKTTTHGDKWLNTFKVTAEMDGWKEGDTVNINVQEKGGYLNFDTIGLGSQVKPVGQATGGTNNTEARLKKLEDAVFGKVDLPTVQVDLEEKDPFDF